MTQKKYQVYVVPHTHWDREWYGSFQLFRTRLVRLMNTLLDLLDRDPEYTTFNLDGQTIVLEDYLEVHPEQRARLARLVSNRRLLVGPWYILPDEFLESGESMVRNLLLGTRTAGEFGHCMQVGYIPDTFGHIAQLPQILRGFDLDCTMNFRGMDVGEHKSELWWEAPDGSRVALHHMSNIAGYSSAGALPPDIDAAADDLRALFRYKTQRATTNVIIAMQGVDHLEPRADLPAILRRANERTGDAEFVLASLEDFWAALKAQLAGVELETVHGELREVPRVPGGFNYVLYNVLSSRIDNKLDNARAVLALEQWAEPWSALAWAQGVADYPHGHLWTGWRWLLKNHPHDSIGGCSIDAVHRQMATRFEWATEIADYLTEERFRMLARTLDLGAARADEAALVLFNGTAWDRDEVVTVDIDLPKTWLQRQAANAVKSPAPLTPDSTYEEVWAQRTRQVWGDNPPDLPEVFFRGLHVRALGGEELPVQVENITPDVPLTPALADGPTGGQYAHRVRVSFRAQVPAYGYATYAVKPDALPNRWPSPYAGLPDDELRNEHLAVRVNPNGAFDLTDLATGQVFAGLGYFEDGGDCGDGYTYSPPLFDRVYTTLGAAPRIARVGTGVGVQRIRIEYDLALPAGLDAARKHRLEEKAICPLAVELSLRAGSRRLEIEVTLANQAKDHRLRMLFPTDLEGVGVAHSAMQFDVMTRPITPEPVPPGAWWVEDPPATFPQHGWMDFANDNGRGLCVINQGVYEFGVKDTPRREVALTLLRAVGYLGAGRDPVTIIAGAGPVYPTPEAQLLGKTFTYRLALRPHALAWHQDEVWRDAAEYLAPPRPLTVTPHGGGRPARASWLRVAGKNAVLSAVKRAEAGDEDALIVRLYNPSDAATAAAITLPDAPKAAYLCNLAETTLGSVPVGSDGTVKVDLPPKKIVTVKLALA
ncbi:MAG: hypothetical protein JXB47_10645 [Anaerolineae bacterium]|nr:hypothetical protein [Anaerolineae bacterium]